MPSNKNLIPLFAALAAAAPAAAPQASSPPAEFTFDVKTSIQSSPKVVYEVQADKGNFYLNVQPEPQCPPPPPGGEAPSCIGIDHTYFKSYNGNQLELSIDDTASQQVYVAPQGNLAFTTPGGAVPDDSYTLPFTYNPPQGGSTWGNLTTPGAGAVACPSTLGEGIYQIFVRRLADEFPDCDDATLQTEFYSGEYNYAYL